MFQGKLETLESRQGEMTEEATLVLPRAGGGRKKRTRILRNEEKGRWNLLEGKRKDHQRSANQVRVEGTEGPVCLWLMSMP